MNFRPFFHHDPAGTSYPVRRDGKAETPAESATIRAADCGATFVTA